MKNNLDIGVMTIDAKNPIDFEKLGQDVFREMPNQLQIRNVNADTFLDIRALLNMKDMLWCLDGHKMTIMIRVD